MAAHQATTFAGAARLAIITSGRVRAREGALEYILEFPVEYNGELIVYARQEVGERWEIITRAPNGEARCYTGVPSWW